MTIRPFTRPSFRDGDAGREDPPLQPTHREAYIHWSNRYIFFHGKRHPAEMGPQKSPRS